MIYFERSSNNIIVSGKTFNHKERIKSLGARFDGRTKTWVLPETDQTTEAIKQLCEELGGGELSDQAGQTSSKISARLTTAPLDIWQETSAFSPQTASDPRDARHLELETPELIQDPSANKDLASGLSVSELMDRINLAVKGAFPRAVWVIGEIQNLNRRKGALYFSLAEPKEEATRGSSTTINSLMWSNALSDMVARHGKDLMDQILAEGLKGRFLCQVNLYKDRGSLSLNVLDVDPNFTKGALALAREKLMRELRAEGIDKLNKQLSLSSFPLHIGLISADGSRAQSDFLHQLFAYHFPGHVTFYAAQMQGEHVEKSVINGIKALEEIADVIVITRGGGSHADLRWFDTKPIALAISYAKVPVVAAIGHQDDVCIAEEVSFRREKTPTAAADFIIHRLKSTRDRIGFFTTTLVQGLSNHMRQAEAKQSLMRERLLRAVDGELNLRMRRVLSQVQVLGHSSIKTLNDKDRILGHVSYQLKQKTFDSLARNRERSTGMLLNLRSRVNQKIAQNEDLHASLKASLTRSGDEVIRNKTHQKSHLELRFGHEIQRRLDGFEQGLVRIKAQIEARDPTPWLDQGWTQFALGKTPVKSVDQLKLGAALTARLRDGTVGLKVTDLKKKPSPDV